MSEYTADMDAEIADIEVEILHLEGALRGIPRSSARERKPVATKLAALRKQHERLVMQVQHATVGATKPGQVL